MTIGKKSEMSIETIQTKKTILRDTAGKILKIVEEKMTDYCYFTLKLKATVDEDGKIKKIPQFPKDWTNIHQSYNKKHNAVALICGEKSGLYVVDYDTQNAFINDAVKFPELKNHYLETNKGYHSYFKWNSEVQMTLGSRAVKSQNIDFQGNKKCVFTEPTTYFDSNNKKYTYKFLHELPLKKMSNNLMSYLHSEYLGGSVSIPTKKTKINNKMDGEEKSPPIDISPLMNEIFNMDAKWEYSKEDKNQYKVTNDSLKCLVNPNKNHITLKHSCIFVNSKVSTINCFGCGKKKILVRDYPLLKKVKEELGLVVKKISADDEKLNDFEVLVYTMLQISAEKKYKKEDGWILKQIENVPTAYEKYMEYTDFLDFLFSNKEEKTYKIYRKRSTNKHQLMDYLKSYNDEELSWIKRDNFKYSFNNGFFDIKTETYTKFKENVDYGFCSSVYMKYDFDPELLDMDFNNIKTPLFDQLVKYHIKDNKVYEILLCLLGRLFFDTGDRDNWQTMVFIKGMANTGKSTFIEIIQELFDVRDIGVIESTLEKTFGLQNLCDKRLIISTDIPEKLSDKLDATTLQKMISGEKITVAVKNKEAQYIDWTTPLLWAGNFLPDYSDKSGSVSRRLAIINMGKKVTNKDASLKQRIVKTELVPLLVKFVKAYSHYINEFGDTVFEDWGKKFGIDYFDKAREEFKQENDVLYAFLTAAPGANKTTKTNIWIEYKEGGIVTLEDFKKKFKLYAKFKHEINSYKWSNTSDNSTLESLGYEITTMKICASCSKPRTGKKCCDNFSNKNRRNKICIKNMKIRDGEVNKLRVNPDDSDDETVTIL